MAPVNQTSPVEKLAKNLAANTSTTRNENSPKGDGKLRVIEGLKGKAVNNNATSDQLLSALDERSYGKTIRQHVREFGAVMALVSCFIAYTQLHKHTGIIVPVSAVSVGLLLYVLSISAPQIIKPLWEGWMKIAHYLGLAVTTVLLIAMWVGVVIPVGAAVRLFGVKVIDLRFRAPVSSYWDNRDAALNDFKLLERQW